MSSTLHAAAATLATALLLAGADAWGTIVWQGRVVEAWPAEALAPPPPTPVESIRPMAARAMAAQRSGFFTSPKGKLLGLTLLVDFSDEPTPYSISEISDWLNKEGFARDGCKGSVKDYFLDASNRQVELVNEVFGWYRASKPKSYYEDLPEYTGAEQLLKEVVDHFDPLVDFSRYDNDKDGTVDALNILYVGKGRTWNQGLWPHAGWVGRTVDRTRLDRYQMSDLPGTFDLFTFAHETGHMLFGWPDLYWFGAYCLMGSHSDDQNPMMINDFLRADQGWIPFHDATASDTGLVLAEPGAKVYRFRNPARPSTEGIAWSYMGNTGRRAELRGSGLFVQHYDLSIDGNSSASKLQFRPIQADRLEELQADQFPSKSNDAKDLFQSGTSGKLDETFATNRWYSGQSTGLSLSDIGKPGATLSFRIGKATSSTMASPGRPFVRFERTVHGWILSAPAPTAGALMELASPDGRIVARGRFAPTATGSA
ncbi:MAG TPA: M6 family metalloprotease domain-containing protein, partial [Fibrobacteria bacterium]|nr:M6 family metalloprotease domain-containing protein [Fibrobacteria bacterium]